MSSIQIIVINDDGKIVDQPTATLPPGALEQLADAVVFMRPDLRVENPDFDSEKEISDDNQPTIYPPRYRAITLLARNYLTEITRGYAVRMAQQQAKAAAESQLSALETAVEVID